MGNPKMDEENSNPETGELSDDDFVARMAERRQAAAEAEPTIAARPRPSQTSAAGSKRRKPGRKTLPQT
jgi:hypothetical protein